MSGWHLAVRITGGACSSVGSSAAPCTASMACTSTWIQC